MEPANFAELRSKIDSWDITAEELLLQKMKIFTINYNEEFQQFCKNMDKFSNNIEQVEIDHLKAISNIKTLSKEKFIENAVDKGEESESESVSNENNIVDTQKDFQITSVETMKTTIDISLNCLNQINKKNKNKEEIEDDTVSVVNSKIMMDKGAKVRLPFVIGTEEFKADKHIGLNVAIEKEEEDEKKPEEDEENIEADVKELLADIKVDPKQREKWDKIRGRREKERKRLEASKTFVNNIPKIEEPEVKVPIENEGDNNNQNNQIEVNCANGIVVQAPDPSKSGGAIPPPPPPPPPPPMMPTIPKSQTVVINKKRNINIPLVNPYARDALNMQQNPALNPEMNNIPGNQPYPQPQAQPMSFQEQLRNRLMGNANQDPNVNQNNIVQENPANPNNFNNETIPNSVLDVLHTEADNKNPLAPVIRDKNIVLNKDKVRIDAFLKTSDFLGGKYDEEEDDFDELSSSIFRRRPTQPKNFPPQENPQINQNIEQNPQINLNQNQGQPMMIMGMPRPQPQEQIQQQIQNQQISMMQNQMLKPPQLQMQANQEQQNQINQQPIQMQMPQPQPQIMQSQFNLFQNETKAIEIKRNRDLENAGNKLKNIFESIDEDEMDPSNIVDKTADITKKVSLFTQSNQNQINESKFNLFDSEPKKTEEKPKISFFNENEDEPKIENNKVNENINLNVNANLNPNINLNTNVNINLEQDKPKPKLTLFDDIGNDTNSNNLNKVNINNEQPKPKPKLSFFNDDDNEPVNEKPKLSFFNDDEKKN